MKPIQTHFSAPQKTRLSLKVYPDLEKVDNDSLIQPLCKCTSFAAKFKQKPD